MDSLQIDFECYYHALATGWFFESFGSGIVRIGGEDRKDFVQRQTTNDIRKLDPTSSLRTVLTSSTARVMDVFFVVEQDGSLLLITEPDRSKALATFLQSRIFFMDKVSVEDVTDSWQIIEIGGPLATQIIDDVFGVTFTAGRNVANSDDGIWILDSDAFNTIAQYILIVPEDIYNAVITRLSDYPLIAITESLYETFRVEQGVPATPYEFVDSYTPLEVGLRSLVSDDKGCYTGQEVLARQITYDKVTRDLVGLRTATTVTRGSKVKLDGKSVGEVTSVTVSPRFGSVALAVLKRPFDEVGTECLVNDVLCTVVKLPFGE